jgi:hypothetical protein
MTADQSGQNGEISIEQALSIAQKHVTRQLRKYGSSIPCNKGLVCMVQHYNFMCYIKFVSWYN